MKTLLTLVVLVTVFSGCESAKYTGRQMFGTYDQQREFGTFQAKAPEDASASWAASGDTWVKEHLW